MSRYQVILQSFHMNSNIPPQPNHNIHSSYTFTQTTENYGSKVKYTPDSDTSPLFSGKYVFNKSLAPFSSTCALLITLCYLHLIHYHLHSVSLLLPLIKISPYVLTILLPIPIPPTNTTGVIWYYMPIVIHFFSVNLIIRVK